LIDRGILFDGNSTDALDLHYGLDTAIMSQIEADSPSGPFEGTQKALSSLGVDISTVSEAELFIVHRACELVGTRAARLSATALAAVVEQTRNDQTNGDIRIGVDGSLVELYPHFTERLRTALREILGETNEARIKIALSKDGSGAGGKSSTPKKLITF
jgi:hexokinase